MEERAARYSDLFAGERHPESDCAYCPICSSIAVIRRNRPDLLEHLSAASRELALAAGVLLEEAGRIINSATEDKPRTGTLRSVDGG